jgi:hypothetical protein
MGYQNMDSTLDGLQLHTFGISYHNMINLYNFLYDIVKAYDQYMKKRLGIEDESYEEETEE